MKADERATMFLSEMVKMYGEGHGNGKEDWVFVIVLNEENIPGLCKVLEEHFRAHANGATVANLLAKAGVITEDGDLNDLPA